MVKYCTLVVMLLLNAYHNYAAAQPQLPGRWIGDLSQENGGFSDEYSFEIYFQSTSSASAYAGRTYVEVTDVLGVMTFSAEQRGRVLYLDEQDLLYSRKPSDMSWCFKSMQLRLVKRDGEWRLEGPWQGTSKYGSCIPGWVSLRKETPKV